MRSRNKQQGPRNRDSDTASQSVEDKGFRSLLAWQKADELASAVYGTLGNMPAKHRWLTVQAMRAAISVPANIAEGYGRGSLGDYVRFLDIARGSLAELEYYLHFVQRERLIAATEAALLHRMQQETGRVLHGLRKALKQKARDGGWDRTGLIHEQPTVYAVDSSLHMKDDP